jgi:hypothetical protein
MTKQQKAKVSVSAVPAVADEITVLACAAGHSASKKWGRDEDGKVQKFGYNAGALFAFSPQPVSDIRSLSNVLLGLEGLPNMLVIRGAPVEGLANTGVRRRLTNFQTPAAGRRWVLIDLDKIQLPEGHALRDDVGVVIEYLVTLLPEEFREVSYHYQLSSSAGMDDASKASVHLWFWLTEPWTDKALKTWAKAVNNRAGYKLIDAALFNGVQPHYTAAPVFENVANPFPVRSGLVEKAREAVAIQAIASAPASSQQAAGGFEPGLGFEGWLARIGDHPGGDGFHEPIIRAAASHVSAQTGPTIDKEALFKTLSKRVLEADRSQHDDAYIEQMASRDHIMPAIDGAIEKYGNRSASRRRSRLIPDVSSTKHDSSLSREEAHAALSATLDGVIGRPST